jgi:4-hydroxy-tetrahydrodipicolinate synthase
MSTPYRFHGVYPVLYAFFDRDGRLDRDAMARQVEHCIAAGAHGLMVPGLVTEVHKLESDERQAVIDLVGELNAGRLPYAVTIGDATQPEQCASARRAREAGADWVILQPPPSHEGSETDLIGFFGRTADALDCPVAIQHNPFNLPVWLSVEGMIALHRQHPNFSVLKGEGTAVETQQLVAGTDGRLAVFGGHGGIEFLSALRAGAAGLIPAPDCLPVQTRIYELFREGTPESIREAERLHKEVLPLIVFMVRSIPALLCYGKRFMGRRLGLAEVRDRTPALSPSAFGLAEMERLYRDLEALERACGIRT